MGTHQGWGISVGHRHGQETSLNVWNFSKAGLMSAAFFVVGVSSWAVVHPIGADQPSQFAEAHCRILIVNGDDTEVSGGSGVLFEQNKVLTAGHVAEDLRVGDSLKVQCGFGGFAPETFEVRPSPSGKPYLYGGLKFLETVRVKRVSSTRKMGWDLAILTLERDLSVKPMPVYENPNAPMRAPRAIALVTSGQCWTVGFGVTLSKEISGLDPNIGTIAGAAHLLKFTSQDVLDVEELTSQPPYNLIDMGITVPADQHPENSLFQQAIQSINDYRTSGQSSYMGWNSATKIFDRILDDILMNYNSLPFFYPGDSGSPVVCETPEMPATVIGVVKMVTSRAIEENGNYSKIRLSQRFTWVDRRMPLFQY